MMYVPRGFGISGGMMGISLMLMVALLAAEGDEGFEKHKVLPYFLLIMPLVAGIVWNRCGARLMIWFAKGNKETADRLACTVESLFFVAVLVAIAVMYNMGLYNL